MARESLMKIASCISGRKTSPGIQSKTIRFKDLLRAFQRLPGFFPRERKPAGHFSAMGPACHSEGAPRSEEVGAAGAVRVGQVEVNVEEMAQKISKAAEAAQQAVDSSRVVVSFNSGWFRGVTCVVNVQGQTVRCRLKSEGAVVRKLLGEARKNVARRLSASGFLLDEFEVGS
jgi:hypothetical protein